MKKKITKLNFRCPLCGRLMYGSPFCDRRSWIGTKESGNCIVLCPERENGPCGIFCYFFCGKLGIEINYRKVLELVEDYNDEWLISCEKFVKIYRKIFEKALSSIPLNKSFEI